MLRAGVKYYWERGYPYFFAAIIMWFLWKWKINFLNNCNMNGAIDGVNMIASLIIGFLGTILPIILGMRNESKFVRYVFEKDKNKLFLKYIREDIVLGLILLFVSVILYFRDEELLQSKGRILFCIWIALITAFLMATYRCLSNMLTLIFSSERDLNLEKYHISSEEMKKREVIQNKYSE